MNSGTSGRVTSINRAAIGVDGQRPPDDHDGNDRSQDELGKIAREVRLERVDALHRGRCQLGALGAVERRGPSPQPLLDQLEAQPREHSPAARRPATSKPQAHAPRSAARAATSATPAPTSASGAPSNPRAATLAIAVACTTTISAEETPSPASSARRTRTARRPAQQSPVEARPAQGSRSSTS